MTVMFGAEGQDYRDDGADIVPLKTDADGNLQVASDLYPIMSARAASPTWPTGPRTRCSTSIRKSRRKYARASIAEIDWFHSVGGKDTLAIPPCRPSTSPRSRT